MPVLPYNDEQPSVGLEVAIAADAYVVGRVRIAGAALLEAGAVIRGDQSAIEIAGWFYLGRSSSIHVDRTAPTTVGERVWIGNRCVVHGAQLGRDVRVEDGAVVLSRSRIGSGSVIAAGSLVPEGAEFPEGSYLAGVPARRQRAATAAEQEETSLRLDAQLNRRG